jgi:CarboxypepD_reg-like domain
MFVIINSVNFITDTIGGKVYDKNTKNELAGVQIICGSDTTYSDINGNFIFKSKKDTNILYFNYNTYESDTLTFILNNDRFVNINK